MDKNIVISIKTILIMFLAALAGYVIYRLGPIFAVLLIATLIVLALEPSVKWFKKQFVFKRQITRSVAVILTYAIFIAVVAIIFTTGLPPVIGQIETLAASLGGLISGLNLGSGVDLSLTNLIPQLSNLSGGIVGVVSSGFSTITTIFSIIMISIYMSLDWENLKRRFISLFPDKNKVEILRTAEEIENNVGQWVKGESVLMTVVGAFSFVGLFLLNVPFALALGLLAGLLEVVPILGPVIAAVLSAIIAFSDEPIKGVAVIILFIIIQQLENNILVPKIMQRVSGFSPLVILIALLIGSNLFGIVGAITAVPITMIAVIVVKSVLRHVEHLK
jgi:predicted PurR-regulated permease PerM